MVKSVGYILLGIGCLFGSACSSPEKAGEEELLEPVPFQEVALEGDFWLSRLKKQKEVLVPFALDKTRPAVDNLRKTANYLKGIKDDLPFPHRYVSSDLYKVMEGAAYLLALERDAALEQQMDSIIDFIAAAQKPDGYLYEAHITGVSANHEHWGGGGMGDKPYSWVVHSHELYDMGHLYEAAVAYYQATGKDKLLRVAEKSARHINHVFFEGDPAYNGGKPVNQAPGHEEIELALVKLFRVTGDSLYLNLAKKFIDIRGVTYRPDGEGVMAPSYAQQHLPVREQREAIGHAVRATYLYSAMADVMALTKDPTLKPALDSIWANIVDTRMHITGGLGAIHGIEGFGAEYLLPNKNAYNETCAAVGNVFFNYRMFLAEKDAKYIDVAEVSLYNNVLAGVNLDGNRFFYVNPLEADGRSGFNQGANGRSPWFGTACCPSNIARLIPQISGMMYAHTDDKIYCTLYGGNKTVIPLANGAVVLQQKTDYPFGESVLFKVTPEKENQKFSLYLRIPTWTGKQFVPGKLYSYVDKNSEHWAVFVNGKKVHAKVNKGFAVIERKWTKDDVVELKLPMPVHFNEAIAEVKDDTSRVCITRGPLVYCAEGIDNKAPVGSYIPEILTDVEVMMEENGLLKGIDFITVPAKSVDDGCEDVNNVKLLPYYAWNNRGNGTMIVWFPLTEALAKSSYPRLEESIKEVRSSFTFDGDNVLAIADNVYPESSSDASIIRWTSWPQTGKSQWVEISLKEKQTLQSISVYWYDDNGGVKLPVSWSLEYKKDGEWEKFPLYVTDSYGVERDRFNMVHPGEDVCTDEIRLNIFPQRNAAVGILEVAIEKVD